MSDPMHEPFDVAAANAALDPIVLRRGERVDRRDVLADAIERMLIVAISLKDRRGLLLAAPRSADATLARKHLAAFLEEALDGDMPGRVAPGAVALDGFGPPDA